jgi:S1-C subfamily serine protease
LKPNDVILQVNDLAPKSFIDFSELLGSNASKDIAFTVKRGGEQKRISVRLVPVSTDMIQQKLGITLEPRTLQMPRGPLKTFMITAVQKGTVAEQAGLQTGMFIMGFDGQAVDDLISLAKSLYAKQKGDGMQLYLLTIKREADSNVSVQERIADLTLR